MSTLTSQVPAVIDYLVTTCTASAALGAATPAVDVLDGPPVDGNVAVQELQLWIGWDPLNPGAEAATAVQDWPNLDHALTLDEAGEITCAAQAWSGTATIKTNRDICASIAGSVAALLRGTVAAGGPGDTTMGGLVFWSRVTQWTWSQQQTPDGTTVLCVFRVAYQARLTT